MESPWNTRLETPAMQLLAIELKDYPLWWKVLASWLHRFDGFLAELECDPSLCIDDTPAQQILSALKDLENRPVTDQEMANLIAHCPFNGWRARFENTPFRWNPLFQSYGDFRATLDRSCACYEVEPDMAPVTAGWLLGMLFLQSQ